MAVLVDMWGTLIEEAVPHLEYHRARVERLLEASGVTPTPSLVEEGVSKFLEVRRRALRVRVFGLREVPAEEEIGAFLSEMGLEPEVTEAHLEAYSWPYLNMTRLREGAAEAVRELSSEHGLALVSNVSLGEMVEGVLERAGLSRYFDAVVTSDRVGVRKPHPAIFWRALEELGEDSGVMVGDELLDDVIGARAAGLLAVLVGGEDDAGAAHARVSSMREVPAAVRSLLR